MEQRPDSETMPIVPLLIFFGVMGLLLAGLLVSQAGIRRESRPTAEPTSPPEATAETTPEPTAETAAAAATWNLDPQRVAAGERIFHSLCMACHGFDAKGIVGLGKTLVGSEFANSLTDDELVQFIIVGREVRDPLNTTGVAMPARGGNPGLTDDQLGDVVAYIRSLNVAAGFEPLPSTGAFVAAAPTPVPPVPTPSGPTPIPTEFVMPSLSDEAAVALIPTSVSASGAGTAFMSGGQAVYVRACSACHGLDGSPVPMLATLPLSESALVKTRDGFGLSNFLTSAHPPVDPREGINHPYRGGYPPLTDEQIRDLVVYLYTLPN
jgi:disulfide bond formation protein DsbB